MNRQKVLVVPSFIVLSFRPIGSSKRVTPIIEDLHRDGAPPNLVDSGRSQQKSKFCRFNILESNKFVFKTTSILSSSWCVAWISLWSSRFAHKNRGEELTKRKKDSQKTAQKSWQSYIRIYRYVRKCNRRQTFIFCFSLTLCRFLLFRDMIYLHDVTGASVEYGKNFRVYIYIYIWMMQTDVDRRVFVCTYNTF